MTDSRSGSLSTLTYMCM